MKKKLLYLFVFTSMPALCQQRVSEQEAIIGATQTLVARGHFGFNVNQVFCDISERGDTLLYEVKTNDGFSVLLSGVKTCIPVFAIYQSNTGQSIFNQEENLGVAMMVDNYRRTVEEYLSDNNRQYHSDQWDNLLDTTTSMEPPRTLSHLLTSHWGESKSNDALDENAYNGDCPVFGDCQVPAGSAAVAMGQLMYYWNYPFFPIATNFIFDWCNMGDILVTADDCYDIKKKNIDKLLYACGVFSFSDYTCSYTGTTPINVVLAMKLFFQYHSNDSFTRTPVYPHPNDPEASQIFHDFWNSIEHDIGQGKPILGYLKSNDGYIYFVCDDYSSDYYNIYINWGDLGQDYYGEYSIANAQNLYLLFNVYPKINYTVSSQINLTPYYTTCIPQAGNVPLYSIVPYNSDTLTSASVSTPSAWRTIPNGATALYQAHKEINLQDGFEAELGCEFEARIEPCEQCEELRENGLNETNGTADIEDNGNDGDVLYSTGMPAESVSIDLFPNPTDGPLTMPVDDEAQEVFVFTLDGRPVGGWHLTARTKTAVTLDVSPLAPAAYLLSVRTTTTLHTARFIKQ